MTYPIITKVFFDQLVYIFFIRTHLCLVDYVHRCGRTGRAGKKGTAVTLITPEQERYAGDIIKALESSFAAVPDELKKVFFSISIFFKKELIKVLKIIKE
jgi:superfamily II DNA/RNA helicase